MSSKNISLVVLAGGLGSRYKGQKQVDPVGENGECLMEFALHDAVANQVNHVVFVVNNQFTQETKDYLAKPLLDREIKVDFVTQDMDLCIPENYADLVPQRLKPWGTGHAVLVAKEVINQPFIVMNADDFYGRNTFKLAQQLVQEGKIDAEHYGMVAFELEKTLSENGTVSRGVCQVEDGFLSKVTEVLKIRKNESGALVNEAEQDITVNLEPKSRVSMNFWILDHRIFSDLEKEFHQFLGQLEEKEKQEFFLPFFIDDQIQKGKLKVWVEQSSDDWFGMTYPDDKKVVMQALKDKADQGIYKRPLWA